MKRHCNIEPIKNITVENIVINGQCLAELQMDVVCGVLQRTDCKVRQSVWGGNRIWIFQKYLL